MGSFLCLGFCGTKMKVLVTGGAGFVGSHLVDALVEAGHDVRILDSLVEQVHGGKAPDHINPNAEFIHADLCDAHEVKRALNDVDIVYHQAAEVGIAQSMYEITRYVRGNDLGTAVLLEEIVRRMPDMEPAGECEYLRSNFIGGIKHLPVRYTPGERVLAATSSEIGA